MASEQRVGADVKAALAVVVALLILGMFLESTYIGIGLALIIIPALLYSASRVPLRYSLMTLMFLALILPNPQEGVPTFDFAWPLLPLGKLLLDHLNTFDHEVGLLAPCSFSGMDLCLVALGIIHWFRKSSGSTIDSAGRVPTPDSLLQLSWLSLGATAFVWLFGLVTGGNFGMSLWQLNAVMYLPLVFLLFQAGLRGPADHKALAKTLFAAAVYKSLLALYVALYVKGLPDPYTGDTSLPYATAHADSLLFADACLAVIALLLERQKIKLWAAFLLPIFALGMWGNKRRLVWVQIVAVLGTVFIVSKDSKLKRTIRRALVAAAPIAALYVMAGWDSGGGMTFKPVRILRSVVDAKSDGSSFWRELENFNLITTMHDNMVFGTGYGHPYVEYVAMPEVDYPLEHYIPHNSILGLWAYCGLVGFAGLAMLWAGGVYFAMRAYHAAENGSDRATALVCFGSIFVWLMLCWGDLGLSVWNGVFTVAPALAVAGKLAVAMGEWDNVKGKRKGSPARPPAVTSARN